MRKVKAMRFVFKFLAFSGLILWGFSFADVSVSDIASRRALKCFLQLKSSVYSKILKNSDYIDYKCKKFPLNQLDLNTHISNRSILDSPECEISDLTKKLFQ